jgi:hypothetical protein
MAPSARQAQAARDQTGRGMLAPPAPQRPANEGLFAPQEAPTGELFASSPHQQAASHVIDNGRQTGHEHLAWVDPEQGVAERYTDRNPAFVGFSPSLEAAVKDTDQQVTVHHNHPRGTALSDGDIGALAFPGLHQVVAHSHDGRLSAAALTPSTKAGLSQMPTRAAQMQLVAMYRAALNPMVDAARPFFRSGDVTAAQLDAATNDIALKALHNAGVIDYMSTRAEPPISGHIMDVMVGAATTGLRKYLDAQRIDRGRTSDRPAVSVRHEEAIARLSGGPREGAGPAAPADQGGNPGNAPPAGRAGRQGLLLERAASGG